MEANESALEKFLGLISDRIFPLQKEKYRPLVDKHAVLKDRASIGPCFFLVGDLGTLKVLEVGEGSREVLGYSTEEIFETGADFPFKIIHPDDLKPCLEMLKIAWDFLEKIPVESKPTHVCNFYYRALKKDRTVIKLQNQVINLEMAENGSIMVTCNIFTDVSHLGMSDQVKLHIVDTEKNTCFSACAQQPIVVKEFPILSKREAEILKLLSEGFSSRQIADKLVISYFTVRTHRKNILEKLGMKNTAEMISYTLHNGMI